MQSDNEIAKRPPPKIELGAEDRAPVLLPPRVESVEVREYVTIFGLVYRSWLIFVRHLDIFLMLMWRPFGITAAAAWGSVEAAPHIGIELTSLLFTVVSMISIIPVVTAWHRMILMGADNPRARISYHLGSAEWAYLKAAAILYGLGYAIGLFVSARTDSQIVSLLLSCLVAGCFYLVGSDGLVNLVGDPDYENLRDRMRTQMEELLRSRKLVPLQ